MKHNQQNQWKRDFLTLAAGQTVSLIGSAAVQFSLEKEIKRSKTLRAVSRRSAR